MDLIELQYKNRRDLPGDFMIWWSEQTSATRYLINLYINETKIAEIEKPRNILYHCFIGTADIEYEIKVIAEDNEGNVLAASRKIKREKEGYTAPSSGKNVVYSSNER